MAELFRREGIAQSLYYSWSKQVLEAEKKRLAGDTARAATSTEVKDPRREFCDLKEGVAEHALDQRLFKKSMLADARTARDRASAAPPRGAQPVVLAMLALCDVLSINANLSRCLAVKGGRLAIHMRRRSATPWRLCSSVCRSFLCDSPSRNSSRTTDERCPFTPCSTASCAVKAPLVRSGRAAIRRSTQPFKPVRLPRPGLP